MKKAFISILIFFFLFHFVIPGCYYLYNGFFNLYSEIDDPPAMIKAVWLNGLALLLTIIIILALPQKKATIAPKVYDVSYLYYFAAIFSVVYYIQRGGYEGVITGGMAGSLMAYLSIFLNPTVFIVILVFYQKKKYNVGWLLLSFIALVTLTGKRSAIIVVILMLLMYPAFDNYNLYKTKLRRYIAFFFLLSPALFILGSKMRGIDMDLLNNELILKAIFGRLSMIELAGIPIHYKDLGSGFDIDLFNEKYGLVHQLKLMLDSLIPGNIFEFDVMPNQYYRAVFLGYSADYAQDNYLSLNLTLPVYFYMFTGFIPAVILTAMLLVGYYLLWRKYSGNVVVSIALITQLYTMLYYFDFVMWFSQIITTALSILTLYGFVFLRKEAVAYFKNYEKKVV